MIFEFKLTNQFAENIHREVLPDTPRPTPITGDHEVGWVRIALQPIDRSVRAIKRQGAVANFSQRLCAADEGIDWDASGEHSTASRDGY